LGGGNNLLFGVNSLTSGSVTGANTNTGFAGMSNRMMKKKPLANVNNYGGKN